jgi:hypothetical protein
VSDPDFMRYEWTKFGRSWIGAFVLFLVAYSITALSAGFSGQLAGIGLAAVLQSLCGLTASIWLLMLVPKLKIASSALPIYVVMLACLWLPASAVDFLWSAILLVPGGWISHSFAALTGASPKIELILLIPACVVPLSLPIALNLANRQLLAVLERQTSDDMVNTLVAGSDAVEEQPAQPASFGAARLISHDEIVQRPNWRMGGWIEQIVAAWLSEEDEPVAEFMLAQNIGGWSKRWRVAALISATGVAITVLVPLPPWVLFLPMVGAGLWAAPLFGGIWPGFRGVPIFGGVIPTYAVFPVGYREISRVMFKANIVRVLAWAPLVVAYATALATRLGNNPRYGIVVGVEVVVLVLTMQPVMVMRPTPS